MLLTMSRSGILGSAALGGVKANLRRASRTTLFLSSVLIAKHGASFVLVDPGPRVSAGRCPSPPTSKSKATIITSMSASSASPAAVSSTSPDPHKFLEDVLGDESMAWVRERNAECVDEFGDITKTEDYERVLNVLDSRDKIPSVAQIGDGDYYNFWQDDRHVQGVWRRTTLESYRSDEPEWRTVLDLDALEPPSAAADDDATAGAATWVWHGSTLLDEGPGAGAPDRAMISLSPGGSDADVKREFDLANERFVDEADGGFVVSTPAKTSVSYRSRDELLIGTDFDGDGSSTTDSGYPRVIKSWRRGTPLSEAEIVFEAEQTDVAGAQYAYHDARDGLCHEFQTRSVTFYTSKYWYRSLSLERMRTVPANEETTPFRPVPIPEDADLSTFGSEATITLRSEWTPPGSDVVYEAGALLTAPMADVVANDWSRVTCLFRPTPTTSLQSTTMTKDYVVLSVLKDVRTALVVWRYDSNDRTWTSVPAPDNVVAVGESLELDNVNRDSAKDNRLFLWRDGYLVPDTLELCDAGNLSATEHLKAKPAMFDASGLCVEQRFCTSKDGARIPYFLIRPKNLALDGDNPTLLDAYGGFEISMLPGYAAGVGVGWLEAGGVKVIANIRGGGEYGPSWHQAALKENRHKCYEDTEAVARDLVDSGVTSPSKLACIGGSNGGLLVGNLITRPVASKLFGAAVCQVPLLDMRTYNKLLAGASWTAEYGDPDKPEEWAYLRRHSPYHLLRHDNLGLPEEDNNDDETSSSSVQNPDWVCPKVLFTTSTRDDRVHPGHARKMVRALLEEARPMGKAPQVHYWENVEGGHGGAADNKQRAHMWALTYTMLKRTLGLETSKTTTTEKK